MTSYQRVLGSLLVFGLAVAGAACGSQSNTSTGPSPVKCQVTLQAPSDSIESTGGKGVIAVTAQPECSWTASSGAAWLTLASSSGQGSGQVEFQAAANTAATMRQGSISVNNQQVPVQQRPAACRFDVSPLTPSVGPEGGTVTVTVTTLQGCAWQASGEPSWVAMTTRSGTGTGSVGLRVAAGGAETRSATLQVAGQTVTLTQSPSGGPLPPSSGGACAYSLTPVTLSMGSAASGATFTLATSAGCPWTAASRAAWITLTSPAQGSGPATMTFTVAANTGGARSGSVAVAGQTSTINQAAAGAGVTSCTYSLGSASQSVAAAGLAGIAVSVSTTPGCAWSARSNDGWITLRSGATGSGAGSVTFDVAANTGAPRTGTLTIAGGTFIVTQAAAAAPAPAVCTYSIDPTELLISEKGGPVSVTVTAGANCAWTATSNESWLTVTQGAAGSGNGMVVFEVDSTGGKKRIGTLTIAGQTFTVTQSKKDTEQP